MMPLARLANVAHSAGEGEVRRLLEQALQIGEGQYGWGFYGVQALYRMIEFNENIGALHALLERPEIDVNCRNKDGLTPLHVAALKNREFAVKLLMDRSDLDVNATADFDLTPLHLAARLGHTRVVKQLFHDDSRLFLHAKTLHDFSALHLVAEGDEEFLGPYLNSRRGSVEQRSAVVVLLREEQEKRGLIGFEHFRDVVGRTALHYAALNGYVEMVRALLEFSYLNPNAVDSYGLTPLHLAVRKGHVSVSCLLMQAHLIDLNCRTVLRHVRPQAVPLHSYRSYMMHLLYPVLCDGETTEVESAGVTPVHIAAGGSYFEILSYLLNSKCVNLRAVDSRGFTALHFAVVYGDGRVVKLLMDQPETDLNCCDVQGMTPLLLSVVHSRLDILKALLGDGTTSVVHTPEGALHHAMKLLNLATEHSSGGHGAIAHYLIDCLEESVKKSEDESSDSSLVHWASRNGNTELMKLILAWRPEAVNAVDGKRRTPLHLAIIHAHTDLVKGLCREQGWRLRAAEVDKAGAIPLDYAFELAHKFKEMRGIQKLLLRRDDVKEYMDKIFKLDMNTLNGLFVGAALFASVTYVAWMQPPLGFSENYNYPLPSPPAPQGTFASYAAVGNINVRLFFAFNTIAFVFSLITIFRGIEALASQRKNLNLGYVSRFLRTSIRHCYWYFVLSTSFIIAAFDQAGRAVMPPNEMWYIFALMYVIWSSWGLLILISTRKSMKRKCKKCWKESRRKLAQFWCKESPAVDGDVR